MNDLAVEQEGEDAVLTFTFPDRLATGAPLTDLAAIDIYRVYKPSDALTRPAPAAPSGPAGAVRAPGEVNVMGATARRAATNVRLAEEAFYREARRAASLPVASIGEYTRGASVVYHDSLSRLWIGGKAAVEPLAYSVVSVRRGGQRSTLSNIVLLAPAVPPDAPMLSAAIPEEGRICLEWTAPEKDLLGRPAELGGYNVYRRILPQEEYEAPLNPKPVTGTTYVDTTAPYGASIVYTLRAVLANNPKVEGLPAEEVSVVYRDVYPPPQPAHLEALPEGRLVRLSWDPVDAPDLAGYRIERAAADGGFSTLTTGLVTDPFFTDESVQAGNRYRYRVRAVDRAGNASEPSAEAVAETF